MRGEAFSQSFLHHSRHFQTIVLPTVQLCDCPGLVFPNFANTRAELVCNGILSIDQLRDVIGKLVRYLVYCFSKVLFSSSLAPTTYVTQRIPRHVLEPTYGISIIKPSGEDVSVDSASPFLL